MFSCIIFLGQIIVSFVNIIISLVGIAVIAIGVLIKTMVDKLTNTQHQYTFTAVNTSALPISVPLETIIICLIVAGVILFLLGVSGCIGAGCKIPWALIVNAIGVSVMAVGKIYLLVIVVQFLAQSTEIIRNALTDVYNTAGGNITLYGIEHAAKCCGIDGPDTYESAGLIVPPTCCANPNMPSDSPISIDMDTPDVDFCPDDRYDGCVYVLSQYIDYYGRIVQNVLISIISVEIADVLFDIIIACFGKRKR